MSGGRATVFAKKGDDLSNQAGDISAVDSDGAWFIKEFFIECKFYRDLSFQSLIYNKNSQAFPAFWKKTKAQALKHRKYPIIIAKQNRRPALIGIRKKLFDIFFCGRIEMPGAFWAQDSDVVLMDFDNRRRNRNIVVQLTGRRESK